MNKTEENNKEIAESIRLAWESLDSHLDGTYLKKLPEEKKLGYTNKFDIKCVLDYAKMIITYAKQLK